MRVAVVVPADELRGGEELLTVIPGLGYAASIAAPVRVHGAYPSGATGDGRGLTSVSTEQGSMTVPSDTALVVLVDA